MGRESGERGVHKMCAHNLSLRLCQDVGSEKICQKLDVVSVRQGSSKQRSEHKMVPQPWSRSRLGTLLAGERGRGGKAKGKILLQPWQKTKAEQQLGLTTSVFVV